MNPLLTNSPWRNRLLFFYLAALALWFLLQFCDLPWTDRVLAFHQTERVVRTASVNQVRQPIYTSSVGRWRPAAHASAHNHNRSP